MIAIPLEETQWNQTGFREILLILNSRKTSNHAENLVSCPLIKHKSPSSTGSLAQSAGNWIHFERGHWSFDAAGVSVTQYQV